MGATGVGTAAEGRQGQEQRKGQGPAQRGDVQCWTCSGWGHRSSQCPSDQHGGGKGVNEVREGPTGPQEESPSSPEDHD
eukprot:3166064-Heterocapsa_arctica.AAC.1